MSGETVTLVWFRRDLRIEDNHALIAASLSGAVVPVFIWSPEEEGEFHPGRASRWWLKKSLQHLNALLQSLGVRLICRRSPSTLAVLLEFIAATGATRLFYNHLYDPVSLVRDHRVKEALSARGILVRSFNGDLLHEPWEMSSVLTGFGLPGICRGDDSTGVESLTFDAFFEKWQLLQPHQPLEAPTTLAPPTVLFAAVKSCPIDALGLESKEEKGSNNLLSRAWLPGCNNAERALLAFLHGGALLHYAANKGKADCGTTSLLSPHLHYGELSVRKICQDVKKMEQAWSEQGLSLARPSPDALMRTLALREYSRFLVFNFPFTHERSLLGHLQYFPWRTDESLFKAWRQGRTGYPLVDAGMRELWATGWTHNRLRVVTASFCVKYLQLPWQWGMKYFWEALLDADLEADVLGWQYVSGSLPDGHDVDRMDDPEEWGVRIDPDGEYIRRWLPELSRLPTRWIYRPGEAPPEVLRAAGVELGCTYPRPVVDVDTARKRLQNALEVMAHREAARKTALANGIEEGAGEHSPLALGGLEAEGRKAAARGGPSLPPLAEAEVTGARSESCGAASMVGGDRDRDRDRGGGGVPRAGSVGQSQAGVPGGLWGPAGLLGKGTGMALQDQMVPTIPSREAECAAAVILGLTAGAEGEGGGYGGTDEPAPKYPGGEGQMYVPPTDEHEVYMSLADPSAAPAAAHARGAPLASCVAAQEASGVGRGEAGVAGGGPAAQRDEAGVPRAGLVELNLFPAGEQAGMERQAGGASGSSGEEGKVPFALGQGEIGLPLVQGSRGEKTKRGKGSIEMDIDEGGGGEGLNGPPTKRQMPQTPLTGLQQHEQQQAREHPLQLGPLHTPQRDSHSPVPLM